MRQSEDLSNAVSKAISNIQSNKIPRASSAKRKPSEIPAQSSHEKIIPPPT